jgi:hypothetical protein
VCVSAICGLVFDDNLAKITSCSRVAEGIRYALRLWFGLGPILHDGRIESISIPSSARSE